LTIAAMLGHAAQSVTQGYVHIDEALKLAITRTSDTIAQLLNEGAQEARAPRGRAPRAMSRGDEVSAD